MTLLEDLATLVGELGPGFSELEEFWSRFQTVTRLHRLEGPESLEAALRSNLNDRIGGNDPSMVLGPCWELFDQRARVRAGRPTADRDGKVAAVFSRVLDDLDRMSQVWQRLSAWDASRNRARFDVAVEIRSLDGADGPFHAGQPIRLHLRAEPEQYDRWLAVYVFQQGPSGHWSLLFPNMFDYAVPWLVPGVEMLIPERGAGYHLRVGSEPGNYTIKAMATLDTVEIPLHYDRRVTRWTGRGGAATDPQPWRDYRDRRRASIAQLCDRWDQQPGTTAVTHTTFAVG